MTLNSNPAAYLKRSSISQLARRCIFLTSHSQGNLPSPGLCSLEITSRSQLYFSSRPRKVAKPDGRLQDRLPNGGFEALFPCAGTLGCMVYLSPPCSSWFICMRMWDHPLCQQVPCLVHQPLPHLPQSSSCCLAVSPLHPSCPSVPLLRSG